MGSKFALSRLPTWAWETYGMLTVSLAGPWGAMGIARCREAQERLQNCRPMSDNVGLWICNNNCDNQVIRSSPSMFCVRAVSGQFFKPSPWRILAEEKRCSEDQLAIVMTVMPLAQAQISWLYPNISLSHYKYFAVSSSLSIGSFPRHWLVSTKPCLSSGYDHDRDSPL